jgi:hypothetical protein
MPKLRKMPRWWWWSDHFLSAMSTNSEDPNPASTNLAQDRGNDTDPLPLNRVQPGIPVISFSVSSATDGLSVEDTVPQKFDPNL